MKLKNLSIILTVIFIVCMLPIAATAAIDPYEVILPGGYNSASDTSKFVANGTKLPMNGRTLSAWVCYKNVNFTDAPYAVVVSNATSAEYMNNNIYEFRIDSPSGKLIATVHITEQNGWANAVDNIGTVTETVVGTHDLYVSTNQPNDLFGFYFKADIKGQTSYSEYSDEAVFSDMAENSYKSKVEALFGLGIAERYDDTSKTFMPDLPITRGVFAKWTAHFIADEIPSARECVFTDVDEEYFAYDEICYLYDNGLLELNSEKTFNPWSFITVREASAMLLRLMGYSPMCDYRGGYPTGYDYVAHSVGLIKGMAPDDYLRRGPAAGMLYSAIDAEYLEISSLTSDGGVTYDKKKGILGKLRNVYKGTGVITATVFSDLAGDSYLTDNTCYIGTEKFYIDDVSVEHYLGVKCEYFYQLTDSGNTKKLLFVMPDYKTRQIIIKSSDVDFNEISSDTVSYYDEKDKKKDFDISSKATWVYNNKAIDVSIEEIVNAKTFSGRIRLVDNGDGWETVFVEEHVNIKIQSYNNAKKELSDELSGSVWNFTDKSFAISDGSMAVSYKDLTRGMLAELYLSHDGDTAIMLVGESKITGIADEITSRGTVLIGSNEYYIANECKDEIILGETTDFYLSRHGEIVYTKINDSTKSVAVLYDITEEDGNAVISLITAANTVMKFTAAPKIWVDGYRYSDYADIQKQILSSERYRPVLYRTNSDGKLFMIDTVKDGAMNTNDTLTVISDYDTSRTYYYRSALKVFSPEQSFEMPNPVKDDTMLIFINQYNITGSDCYFGKVKGYSSNDEHAFGFYSFTRDNKIADIVFCPEYSNHKWNGAFAFISAHTAVNARGSKGLNVSLSGVSGEQRFWVPEENTVMTETMKSFNIGDVFRIATDVNNTITEVAIISFAGGESKNSIGLSATVHKSNGAVGSVNMSNCHVYGKITDIIDGYFVVEAYGKDNPYWIYAENKTLISVEDENINNPVSPSVAKVGDVICAYISGSVQIIVHYPQ